MTPVVPVPFSVEKIKNFMTTGKAELGPGRRKHEGVSLEGIVDNLAAETSHPGFVELATAKETKAGKDKERAVTPAGLKSALESFAVGGTIKLMSFRGTDGTGGCAAVGLVVGDTILSVVGLTSNTIGDQADSFEKVVTEVDQINQVAYGNLASETFMALVSVP